MSKTSPEDLALYFQRNGDRLLQLYSARRAFPPCWTGFLFPQAWFLYRKMYVWAAAVSAGPLLIAYVPDIAWVSGATSLVGIFGLKLYFRQAERTIRHIRESETEEAAEALIARAGGVSRTGAWIGLAFSFSAFVLSLKTGAHSTLGL